MEFEVNLMENLIELHSRLANFRYRHESYQAFTISDPKTRKIHKATVIDRVLHRAVYRKLYPIFDPTFIIDSFSCRKGKGTHKALDRFRAVAWAVSHNHRRTIWVLKCDIRKFFASIDHVTLIHILDQRLDDKLVVNLLSTVVESFHVEPGKGLPLGNLTSQLFANIYMNEFDQFVKHGLRFKHYIRYADDFVFFCHKTVVNYKTYFPLSRCSFNRTFICPSIQTKSSCGHLPLAWIFLDGFTFPIIES